MADGKPFFIWQLHWKPVPLWGLLPNSERVRDILSGRVARIFAGRAFQGDIYMTLGVKLLPFR
jgi:hypothetical protein